MSRVSYDYLVSRGYTKAMLVEEGVEGKRDGESDTVIWYAKSITGKAIGRMTRYQGGPDDGKYRWSQADDSEHIPQLYGSVSDYRLLYEKGEAILVEGSFDRVAVKRAFPDRPVLARLTKGVGISLVRFLTRYCGRVWLAFDMDSAGELAAEDSKKKLQGIQVERILYPFKDPSMILKERGVSWLKDHFETQFRHLG